jgi:hypothetical protein
VNCQSSLVFGLIYVGLLYTTAHIFNIAKLAMLEVKSGMFCLSGGCSVIHEYGCSVGSVRLEACNCH